MNQSNGKILTLNAQEARNLHAEIYDLMATITRLSQTTTNNTMVTVGMDGGGFK
jgi:ribosomal protein L16 Arg81 hydroxylase